MKNLYPLLTLFSGLVSAGLLRAQTPTHIDQGTTDDSVHILDEPGYLFVIVALVVVLVIWLFLMRRRIRSKRRSDRD